MLLLVHKMLSLVHKMLLLVHKMLLLVHKMLLLEHKMLLLVHKILLLVHNMLLLVHKIFTSPAWPKIYIKEGGVAAVSFTPPRPSPRFLYAPGSFIWVMLYVSCFSLDPSSGAGMGFTKQKCFCCFEGVHYSRSKIRN